MGDASLITAKSLDTPNELTAILSAILERAYSGLIERLFVQAIPLPEADAFYQVAQQLKIVSASRDGARAKLRQVGHVLTVLKSRLNTAEARSSPSLRALRSYLDAVLPWIDEADAQWLSVQLALADLSTPAHWTNQSIGVLDQIERLLNLPALRQLVRQPLIASFRKHVVTVKQLLGKIHLLHTLPGDASLNDYLAILESTPEWLGEIGKTLLPLVSTLSCVCQDRPLPASRDLKDHIQWLMDVVTATELHEKIAPHLGMLLGNDDHARQLTALLHFAQAMTRYPVDGATVSQVLWLVRAVADSGVFASLSGSALDGVIPGWSGSAWAGSLASDQSVLGIIDAMLTSDLAAVGWSGLMKEVASASLPGLSQWMAGQIAKNLAGDAVRAAADYTFQHVFGHQMPLHLCQELEKFYRESISTESWTDMFARLSSSLLRTVGPQVFGNILDHPHAGSTLRFAEVLQGHTDWMQTLKWFAAQDCSHNAVMTQLYSHYATVLIVWKAYGALTLDDHEESEAALRQLAGQLHDAELVRQFPTLGKLVDLLPLLPALRQIHEHIDIHPGSSLWERTARWQEALTQADTPALREAGEKLTQCAVNWLVDTGMWGCDRLASATWSPGESLAHDTERQTGASGPASVTPEATTPPFPSASTQLGKTTNTANTTATKTTTSAATKKASEAPATTATTTEASRATEATTTMKATATTSVTATVDVTMGAGLGLVGAACLMYGLWQCMQRREDYVLVGQPLIPTHMRVMPFIASAIALTAAGVIVYPHIRSYARATANTPAVPADCEPAEIVRLRQQYPDVAQAVDALELPDWGCLSKDLITASNVHHRSAREVDQESLLFYERRHPSTYRGTPLKQALQPTYIDLGLRGYLEDKTANPTAQAELQLLMHRCATQAYVLAGVDPEERATRKLLKLIQSVTESARSLDVASNLAARSRLREIWIVLYDLYTTAYSGLYAEQVHAAGALFDITSELPFRDLAEAELNENFVTPELTTATAATVINAYDPILDPGVYIDDYIDAILAHYTYDTGRKFTASSMIEVTLAPVFIGDMDHLLRQEPKVKKKFSIRDIVLGQHYYVIDKMRIGGTTYKIESMTESNLMDRFKEKDLQTTMKAAMARYRGNKDAVANLKTINRALIESRCLWFLDKTSRFEMFANAVKGFLAGANNAMVLRFHRQVINGGFCIAVSPSVFLILSVDEPIYFYVFGKEFRYFSNNARQSAMIPDFPDEFLDWTYSKIPIETAVRYYDRETARKNRYVALRFGGGLPALSNTDLMNAEAFRCSKPLTINALDEMLTTVLLDRVSADIDTMIFSEGERAMLHLLDVVNALLAYSSLAATIVFPGTGSLLTMTCSAIVNLSLDSLSVLVAGLQMRISDRAADKDGYAFDTFTAVALLGLSVRSNVLSVAKTPSRTYKSLAQAVATYRGVRKTIAKKFRSDGLSVPRHLVSDENFQVIRPAPDKTGIVAHPIAPPPRVGPKRPSGLDVQELAHSGHHFHYPASRTFQSVGMTITPGNETVGYRSIIGTEYVQLLTMPSSGMPTAKSRNLVVSAIGGYLSSDLSLTSRAIPLPPRMTLQMLTPHDADFLKTNVDTIINDPNFVAYLKIDGHIKRGNFLPQDHADWLFGQGYDPSNVARTHGPINGLMNYRHIQNVEDQGELWRAIGRNRVLAEQDILPRSDVLVLNDGIKDVWQSSPGRASISAVLDLDKRGLLVNANGERYDSITFAHARSNFDRPEGLVPADSPDFFNLAAIGLAPIFPDTTSPLG